MFGKKGYTLHEIVIAIAIIAVLIVPLIVLFHKSSTTSERGKRNLQALLLCQYILEKVKNNLVSDLNYYDNLEDKITELNTSVVQNPPEALIMFPHAMDGKTTTAVLSANALYTATKGIPPLPSRHFAEFEDLNADGFIDGNGINKTDYPDLYNDFSRYLCSVSVSPVVINPTSQLKKVTVTLSWQDHEGKNYRFSLYSLEGRHVATM